jgi:hypothetical protein
MSDVLGGKPTPWWAFVLGAGAALITALLLVQVTPRLLQREKSSFRADDGWREKRIQNGSMQNSKRLGHH